MSKVYSIKTVQLLPVSMDTAWEFFSSPATLKNITPPSLGFDIISKHHGEKMYPGQVIEYKVKPVLGMPLYWMTEIVHYKIPFWFLGDIANALMVKKQLKQIFDFRYKKAAEIFGGSK